jgi:hypothetical protein
MGFNKIKNRKVHLFNYELILVLKFILVGFHGFVKYFCV